MTPAEIEEVKRIARNLRFDEDRQLLEQLCKELAGEETPNGPLRFNEAWLSTLPDGHWLRICVAGHKRAVELLGVGGSSRPDAVDTAIEELKRQLAHTEESLELTAAARLEDEASFLGTLRYLKRHLTEDYKRGMAPGTEQDELVDAICGGMVELKRQLRIAQECNAANILMLSSADEQIGELKRQLEDLTDRVCTECGDSATLDDALRWPALITARLGRSKAELASLLARIHRDGGHHTEQVGLEQSARDADRVVVGIYARLAAVEALDQPWPLKDVLSKLSEAATHLLRDHDCDRHGYEQVNHALDAAAKIQAALAEPSKDPNA